MNNTVDGVSKPGSLLVISEKANLKNKRSIS